jgi:hypothetical protein
VQIVSHPHWWKVRPDSSQDEGTGSLNSVMGSPCPNISGEMDLLLTEAAPPSLSTNISASAAGLGLNREHPAALVGNRLGCQRTPHLLRPIRQLWGGGRAGVHV